MSKIYIARICNANEQLDADNTVHFYTHRRFGTQRTEESKTNHLKFLSTNKEKLLIPENMTMKYSFLQNWNNDVTSRCRDLEIRYIRDDFVKSREIC